MWLQKFYLLTIHLVLLIICVTEADDVSPWRWSCLQGKCIKKRNDAQDKSEPVLSLEACKMFCNDYGLLWPQPTGDVDLGSFLSKINLNNIDYKIVNEGKTGNLMRAAAERFKTVVAKSIPTGMTPKASGKPVFISLDVQNPDMREFSLTMDEGYKLRVTGSSGNSINATITADNFFGIRHGLETLSQLLVYDDIRNQMLMVRDVVINDKPAYPYRGILLDTARNYYDIDSIKLTIDAMAAVKLNTFHWHITDSHSFPFVSERRPNLSRLGAYTPAKVYTKSQIQDVVQYALERGVRVLPEFDAPAHVGEGWQDTGLTVCFKANPWSSYCVEPPCGQLNPTRDEVYQYLGDIYQDMADIFETDIFHMGGDEVHENCWNSSTEIQEFMLQNRWNLTSSGFLDLWNYFQMKAQDKAYQAFGKKLPLILWTSTLTEYKTIDKYLNKDDYIIQVWTEGNSPQIQGLLKKGYRLIISNYDALYFDCGFGSWVGTNSNNWCSPYIGWQKVYDNSVTDMGGEYKDLILGGEAALWSEQVDSAALHDRLWPRAAALAERLWSDPATDWQHAQYRMLHTRERLVRMGIRAESIQPEWCYRNEGYCY